MHEASKAIPQRVRVQTNALAADLSGKLVQGGLAKSAATIQHIPIERSARLLASLVHSLKRVTKTPERATKGWQRIKET